MAIKLYDAVPSSNCERVKIVLHEKNLAYDCVRLDLKKRDQKKSDFLELNPYGKVPVIDDGGKILFESCVINEYLEETYPAPALTPKDPHARGQMRLLIDYGLNYLHESYWALRGEMLKKEPDRDAAVVEAQRRTLRDLLSYLEIEIGDKPYFMGEFTLADIALVPRFLRMETYGVLPMSALPRLGGWLQRMKQRPSVKTIL